MVGGGEGGYVNTLGSIVFLPSISLSTTECFCLGTTGLIVLPLEI